MFSTSKRIFAGKPSLQSEPFCPYITNDSGRASLFRSFYSNYSAGASPHARPSLRDGKHRV